MLGIAYNGEKIDQICWLFRHVRQQRWCWWGAERRVKHAHTQERGPPSEIFTFFLYPFSMSSLGSWYRKGRPLVLCFELHFLVFAGFPYFVSCLGARETIQQQQLLWAKLWPIYRELWPREVWQIICGDVGQSWAHSSWPLTTCEAHLHKTWRFQGRTNAIYSNLFLDFPSLPFFIIG